MIEPLRGLDKKLRHLEPYFGMSTSELQSLNVTEREKIKEQIASNGEVYRTTLLALKDILETLEYEQIIEAYRNGNRIMQRSIAAHMGQNFNSQFIPIMKEAFADNHTHTIPIFLQIFADNLKEEATVLALEQLHSSSRDVKIKAISVCHQLKIKESLSTLNHISEEAQDSQIASFAERIHNNLQKWFSRSE